LGGWQLPTADTWKRQAVFWCALSTNLLVLIGMKYLPFLAANLNRLTTSLRFDMTVPEPTPLVAIGVSYFVFQAISYLIDVYWQLQEPERHFGIFALYLSFFPKLLQGPIERAGDLLPQLRVPFRFDSDNFRVGLLTFAWGRSKAVIADRLALYVNLAWRPPGMPDCPADSHLSVRPADLLRLLRLYGHGPGCSRMFNIRLTQNFRTPYLATSVGDFWRRWHISFSRWILDYLFKPLQMHWRNLRQAGTVAALIVTFLLSGLWHGASWCFIIWGGLHGLYLACSVVYKPLKRSSEWSTWKKPLVWTLADGCDIPSGLSCLDFLPLPNGRRCLVRADPSAGCGANQEFLLSRVRSSLLSFPVRWRCLDNLVDS
jgi:D-alanyl-lipoteichoic acid acyltransferase DltB (MBOAT superfamily)